MANRKEWFAYFEDIFKNEYLYIYNIGYYDYRIRRSAEGKEAKIFPHATLHFVTQGKGHLILDGKHYTPRAGDVFSLPEGKSVAFYPDEEDPWCYYWFNLVGDGIGELRRRVGLSESCPVISTEHMPKIQKQMDDLLDSEFNYGGFYFRALSTLYAIVSLFVRETDRPAAAVPSLVGQAKEIILSSYRREDFSVSEIHTKLHVSEPYLRRVFKKETGRTLQEFLINRRLSKAADLLRANDYSIRELCYLVGYTDDVYFVRQFKKKYGVPPKRYRRFAVAKEI